VSSCSSSYSPGAKAASNEYIIVAIGRLHFEPDALQDNVHTLLASVSDIALGGPGHVNGIPARVKRRKFPSFAPSFIGRNSKADIRVLFAAAISRVQISSTQGPGIELTDV
jgi:large subunit ribosomal protein L1